MFFLLSKVISWIIMPLSLVIICLMSSLIIKKSKLKKALLFVGIGSLLFFSNPFFATLVMNGWEPEPILYQDIDRVYDYGIVLAGITIPDRPPYDRIQFSRGADRIAHAVELYKLGKIRKILISGGSGTLTFKGKSESSMIKAFTINAGVPIEDVIIEDQSRNTRENALYSSKLIEKPSNVLLITSAFHMYRASGCFKKASIAHDVFPTDYYGDQLRWSPGNLIIPKVHALEIWTKLFKEWLGVIAYKMAGYI